MSRLTGMGLDMALTAMAIKNLKPRADLYRMADSGGLCLEVCPFRGQAMAVAL